MGDLVGLSVGSGVAGVMRTGTEGAEVLVMVREVRGSTGREIGESTGEEEGNAVSSTVSSSFFAYTEGDDARRAVTNRRDIIRDEPMIYFIIGILRVCRSLETGG